MKFTAEDQLRLETAARVIDQADMVKLATLDWELLAGVHLSALAALAINTDKTPRDPKGSVASH